MLFAVAPRREHNRRLDADLARAECAADHTGINQQRHLTPIDLEDAIAARQAGFRSRTVLEYLQHSHLAAIGCRRQPEPDVLALGKERLVGCARRDVAVVLVERTITNRLQIGFRRREPCRIEPGYVLVPEVQVVHDVANVGVLTCRRTAGWTRLGEGWAGSQQRQ